MPCSATEHTILNAAGYCFAPVAEPAALREALRTRAEALGLLGTVLVAAEGINVSLAGPAAAVREFMGGVREIAGFEGLRTRESWSARAPFGKLAVKLKREIIRMNRPAIQPAAGRAPAVDAVTVRRWLDAGHDDAGRPVVMLDTRNAFEVDYGTFEGALDWRLAKFSDFPAALQRHRARLEGSTVVSFCTGGIRCEKAALYMLEAGLAHVWQLDGGILQYFEDAGGEHFAGRCFVFDQREALGPGPDCVRP